MNLRAPRWGLCTVRPGFSLPGVNRIACEVTRASISLLLARAHLSTFPLIENGGVPSLSYGVHCHPSVGAAIQHVKTYSHRSSELSHPG